MSNIYENVPMLNYHIIAVAFFIIIMQLSKKWTKEKKIKSLYILAAVNFLAYLVNTYGFYMDGDHILTLFPLQLCNIAVFAIPLALHYKKSYLFDFVIFINTLGALAALAIPNAYYLNRIYSYITASFYVFHFLVLFIPLAFVKWGIYKPELNFKNFINLNKVVIMVSFPIHLLNLFINNVFHQEANYFFTMVEYSAPINPVFNLFSSWIPYDYFFLLPAFPIFWIYLIILSLPSKLVDLKRKAKEQGELEEAV